MEAALKQEEQNLDGIIDRIVNEWQLPLLRLCFIQLRDRTMAEDAVQETFTGVSAVRKPGWSGSL